MSLGLLVHGVSLVAYLVATGGTTSRARVHMVMIIFMSDQVIGGVPVNAYRLASLLRYSYQR